MLEELYECWCDLKKPIPDMFSTSNLKLWCNLACLSLFIFIGGCGQQVEKHPTVDNKQSTKPDNDATAPTVVKDTDKPGVGPCPTRDDVSNSIMHFRKLLEDAQAILPHAKRSSQSDHAQIVKSEIIDFRKKKEEWKATNDQLIEATGCLLNAKW